MSSLNQEKSHDSYAKNELYSLNRIFGLGVKNNFSISQNNLNGLMAWITGPYIIFYDIKTDEQVSFLKNPNNKILSCVQFSKNGKFIATGEGNCKNGEISIYEIKYNNEKKEENHVFFHSYKYHKYGIEKILFFKNDNFILSIGDRQDKIINIYDISKKEIIYSTKYNRPILSCDACDEFMVLCGNKFIKIYNYEKLLEEPLKGKNGTERHMVDLSKLNESIFVSTVIFPIKNEKKIFFLTYDCYLVELKPNSYILNRWVNLKSSKGLSLCIYDTNYIGCGCGDNIIRIFHGETLKHYTTLNRICPLGKANVEFSTNTKELQSSPDSKYADIISVSYNEYHKKFITVYSDKTLFIWNIDSNKKCLVFRYNIFHSGSITCMDYDIDFKKNVLKLITVGDDCTGIYWNLKLSDFIKNDNLEEPKRIAYSKYIRQIFYIGKNFDRFKISKNQILGSDEGEFDNTNNNNIDENPSNLTSVKFSPDKNYVSIGDNLGNVYIYSLLNFQLIQDFPFNNGEINSIDMINDKEKNKSYLAIGGADCFIGVLDITRGLDSKFDFYDDCISEKLSSSIISVIFCTDKNNKVKLVTGELNSTITFFSIENNSLKTIQKINDKNLKTYCLTYCPSINKIISGHNGRITIWKTSSCIIHRDFQVNKGEKLLDNFRVACDSKGCMFATSNNDKIIRIRALHNGKLLTKIQTAESISSLFFIMNDNYLIATSVEGYIYFYKLNQDYVSNLVKDNNLIISTEERNKINKKLKLLQLFMESENNLSNNENIRLFIEKCRNSEEMTLEDLHKLDSYVKDTKMIQNENVKKENDVKPIELKEEEKNENNDEEENENNDNNKDNVNNKAALFNRSKIFEKGLKEFINDKNLNKSINRKSLADTYDKKNFKNKLNTDREKKENENKNNIPISKTERELNNNQDVDSAPSIQDLTQSKKEFLEMQKAIEGMNEKLNEVDKIIDKKNSNSSKEVININDINLFENGENNNNYNNINNNNNINEDKKINNINNNENNKIKQEKNERKEEREIILNNQSEKFTNLNINTEINENEDIKENIESTESISSKKKFNEKIIENSQSKVSQSFVRNIMITQSNFDINCVSQSKKFKNLIQVTKNNFSLIPKRKIDRVKRLEKAASFSFNHNISIKDKLIDSVKKVDIENFDDQYELEELEKGLESLLDKVRIKLGNQSKDPTMEKLLEKYSVLLIDRINKNTKK